MISDRRRVERALVPGMLLAVVLEACGRDSDNEDANAMIAALDGEVAKPFEDILDPAKRAKMARRCRHVQSRAWAAAEFWETDKRKGASCGKVYLAVSMWIAGLTQRGAIEVGDSPFTEAYEALLDGMDEHQEALAEMERSATKAAERLRRFFEAEGYFVEQGMREAA